jgi:hypothetical protein
MSMEKGPIAVSDPSIRMRWNFFLLLLLLVIYFNDANVAHRSFCLLQLSNYKLNISNNLYSPLIISGYFFPDLEFFEVN